MDESPRKPTSRPPREPLRELSAVVPPAPALDPAIGPALAPHRPSSMGELLEERDWIHPVPANKPDYGPVLDENGHIEDIPDRRRAQIADLSACVDITRAEASFDSSFISQDAIDTSNILKDLDL